MANLSLKVNGKEYAGWKSVRVTRSLEAVAGGFELSVSDRWSEKQEPWPIFEEDECTVCIDRVPVITGWVDKADPAHDAGGHSLAVAGRDRTGALVDCDALLDSWEFLNIPLITLAQKLADPHGVAVSVQPGIELGPIAKLTVDPGEKAFEVLARACRIAGVLPTPDGLGGILLARAGALRAVTPLVLGQNIKAASSESDATNRFRRYVVMGQGAGSDDAWGEAQSVIAEAADDGVRRTSRVAIVRADGNVTREQAKRRAEWEASVRAARAYAVTIPVQGWKMGNGELWPINALVHVRDRILRLDAEMLITQAVHSLDTGGGSVTELTLRRPDAFKPEPLKNKGVKAPWGELARGAL